MLSFLLIKKYLIFLQIFIITSQTLYKNNLNTYNLIILINNQENEIINIEEKWN